MDWKEWSERRLDEIRSAGRTRRTRDFDAAGPEGLLEGGNNVVSFASNDYLGLSQHPDVVAGARRALETWGAGSGSARLIVGSRPIHSELEAEIAEWKDKEKALLFPNGYAANVGVLSTFGTAGTLICSDELNHASIVDGCRMAKATVAVYPHRDVDALDALLEGAERSIVVSDSVFSMDGDVAPIDDLAEVCARHGSMLVLDEAHAVLGPDPKRADDLDRIRVGTLSKFLGAMGGFVAADTAFIDVLTNKARSFIFTTASSPADSGAALAALKVLRSDEGKALAQRLRSNVDRVAPGHPSPIVPVLIGEEDAAVAASEHLLKKGFLVPAIRPPSVPPGTSRLRVTLSAAHTTEQIDGLLSVLHEIEPLSIGA
jgi:8-amino-7-oxononanoate synthase